MYRGITFLAMIMLMIMLTACGEAEPAPTPEPTPVHVPKHKITQQVTWENMILSPITPVCSFEVRDADLYVFTDNEGDSYIQLKRFYFSSNNLWKQLIATIDSKNLLEKEGYTICSVNGTTYAFIPMDDESGFLVSTKLESGYCERMADEVWRVLSGS